MRWELAGLPPAGASLVSSVHVYVVVDVPVGLEVRLGEVVRVINVAELAREQQQREGCTMSPIGAMDTHRHWQQGGV